MENGLKLLIKKDNLTAALSAIRAQTMTEIIALLILLVVLVGGWFTKPIQNWLKKEDKRFKDEYKNCPRWTNDYERRNYK